MANSSYTKTQRYFRELHRARLEAATIFKMAQIELLREQMNDCDEETFEYIDWSEECLAAQTTLTRLNSELDAMADEDSKQEDNDNE